MSARLVAGLLLLMALGAAVAIYLEHRHDRHDIEAIADATRERVPDHVPDEWVKEFRQ